MPMIAFIGVRISWLIEARNEPLAWLAASASWRAAWSSTVRSSTRRSSVSTSSRNWVGHVVEGHGQSAHLVLGADRRRRGQVAGRDGRRRGL